MSDIKVGDLVMVVRPSLCGCRNNVGKIFKVTAFSPPSSWRCSFCKRELSEMSANGHDLGAAEISRLKRIPPLSELDRVTEKEELTA